MPCYGEPERKPAPITAEPVPSAKAAIPGGSTAVRSSARSASAKGTTSVASAISPTLGATDTPEQPSTKCWLVRTLPSSQTTEPDPTPSRHLHFPVLFHHVRWCEDDG